MIGNAASKKGVFSSAFSDWISVSQFASLADISERKARNVLSQCHAGTPWRGCRLNVRRAPGRGGPGGLRYEVRLDSLPADLQAKWQAARLPVSDAAPEGQAPATAEGGCAVPARPEAQCRASVPAAAPGASVAAAAGAREWEWRLEIIRPALACPAGSRGRAEAVNRIAATEYRGPDGGTKRVSTRSVWRWIAAYDGGRGTGQGVAGLTRKERRDRRAARVIVSRRWDAAVPFDEPVKRDIADKLRTRVRSLWAENVPGWCQVARLARTHLVELTRRAGFDKPDAELLTLCAVPRALVERERRYRKVGIKRKDAKSFFDHDVPRVRRTRAGMAPMEVVNADVHPMDVLVHRPDGSICTPRMIAWHDIATNRVFATFVILPEGQGIRQEHVVKSFIDMTQHPEWGMPQTLYLDNGGEFRTLGFVDDALKLAKMASEQFGHGATDGARRSMIVKAQPYNAPAKPIEGLFAVLEQQVFAMMPGWIGGNRMVKKTANVGKAPVPFPGSEAKLTDAIATAMEYFATKPQSALNGRSPRDAFADAVTDGWRRVDIDPDALAMVFAKQEFRTIDQGEISINGRGYQADELLARSGEKVIVRIPLVSVGDDRVYVFSQEDDFLAIAVPTPAYGFLDGAGCKDKGKRQKAQSRTLKVMTAGTARVDLVAEMTKTVALHAAAPVAESAGTIRLTDGMEQAAAAGRARPAPDEQERLVGHSRKRLEAFASLGSLKKAAG